MVQPDADLIVVGLTEFVVVAAEDLDWVQPVAADLSVVDLLESVVAAGDLDLVQTVVVGSFELVVVVAAGDFDSVQSAAAGYLDLVQVAVAEYLDLVYSVDQLADGLFESAVVVVAELVVVVPSLPFDDPVEGAVVGRQHFPPSGPLSCVLVVL